MRTGFQYFADVPYSVHVVVEGTDQGIVDATLAALQGVAGDAQPIENSLPPIFRANPFGSVDSLMLGPGGELWLPIHAFLPWSRAQEAREAVDAFLEEHREVMERYGMATSLLTATSGHAFVYEPSFYWPDAPQQFRLDKISPRVGRESCGACRRSPRRARRPWAAPGPARVFDRAGAVHIQMPKYYAYQELLEPTSREVLAGGRSSSRRAVGRPGGRPAVKPEAAPRGGGYRGGSAAAPAATAWSAQHPPQHLAGGVARQRRDHVHGLGQLVAGQRALAEGHQLVQRRRLAAPAPRRPSRPRPSTGRARRPRRPRPPPGGRTAPPRPPAGTR